MNYIRTDLALEAHEMLTEAAEEIHGITCDTKTEGGITISRVVVESEEASQKINKPKGQYITLELAGLNISEGADYENTCQRLAKELSTLLSLKDDSQILVVGLGNWNITPDALGPKVISKLMITRHLHTYMPEQTPECLRPVCGISPGVLGITGMETGEVIQGVCDKIKPDAVIVIDALAARNLNRISTTIQLCDTGITPGAGVGNKRKALNKDTLGVPVIAVGVPTVIDAITLTADMMQASQSPLSPDDENLRDKSLAALRASLPDNLKQFIVAPKDVDLLIDRISKVVANGINLALHKEISLQDIEAYIA